MSKSNLLDVVTRIYKNADKKILAIDTISINIKITQLIHAPNGIDDSNQVIQKIHRSVDSIKLSRELVHLTTGGSRIVALVQTMGRYSSIETNGGNYLIAKWKSENTSSNDVELSFEQGGVAKVGDTL